MYVLFPFWETLFFCFCHRVFWVPLQVFNTGYVTDVIFASYSNLRTVPVGYILLLSIIFIWVPDLRLKMHSDELKVLRHILANRGVYVSTHAATLACLTKLSFKVYHSSPTIEDHLYIYYPPPLILACVLKYIGITSITFQHTVIFVYIAPKSLVIRWIKYICMHI